MNEFVGKLELMQDGIIRRTFASVYEGAMTPMHAQKILHLYCNTKGFNPAYDTPITMLMITNDGQKKLREYEEFLMETNWLIAKLSARDIKEEQALDVFFTSIERFEKESETILVGDELLEELLSRRE